MGIKPIQVKSFKMPSFKFNPKSPKASFGKPKKTSPTTRISKGGGGKKVSAKKVSMGSKAKMTNMKAMMKLAMKEYKKL